MRTAKAMVSTICTSKCFAIPIADRRMPREGGRPPN
jgi:hypothetical protein